MKTIRRKCPQCLPEGGAIFEIIGDVKRCQNCHLELPYRRIKASGSLTPSQRRLIARLRELGWSVDTEMIGRNVFIRGNHPRRSMWSGDSLFGTVGPRGSFEITLQRIGLDKKLNTNAELLAYLI